MLVLSTIGMCIQKNEISKESFVRNMRSIIGDQMLKMAVYKFQSQVDEAALSVVTSIVKFSIIVY